MRFRREFKDPAIVERLKQLSEDELAKLLGIERQTKRHDSTSKKKPDIIDELLNNPVDVD